MRSSLSSKCILLIILIDAIGMGIATPTLPFLLQEITGSDGSQAGVLYGGLISVYALIIFLAGPFVGALSDKYGRRPIIIMTLLGTVLSYTLFAVAQSILLLFIVRILAGFCGSNVSSALAYVADVTPPEKRPRAFGVSHSVMGVGLVLGPTLGGALAEWGLRTPFWFIAGLSAVNLLLCIVFLQESRPLEVRRSAAPSSLNPLVAIASFRSPPRVFWLMVSIFFCQLTTSLVWSAWPIFTHLRFGWGTREIGVFLAVAGALSVVSVGGLALFAIPRFGSRTVILWGLPVYLVSLVACAFSFREWQLYAALLVSSLGWLSLPALQGTAAAAVSADRQGSLQGALGSLSGLAFVVGPIAATTLIGYATRQGSGFYFPGAHLILAGISLVLVMMSFLFSARPILVDRTIAQDKPVT